MGLYVAIVTEITNESIEKYVACCHSNLDGQCYEKSKRKVNCVKSSHCMDKNENI